MIESTNSKNGTKKEHPASLEKMKASIQLDITAVQNNLDGEVKFSREVANWIKTNVGANLEKVAELIEKKTEITQTKLNEKLNGHIRDSIRDSVDLLQDSMDSKLKSSEK